MSHARDLLRLIVTTPMRFTRHRPPAGGIYLTPAALWRSREPGRRDGITLPTGRSPMGNHAGIFLGPPDRLSEGYVLTAAPEPVRDPRWLKLAEGPGDAVSSSRLRRLGNVLGLTLSAGSVDRLLAELLLVHGDRRSRWGGVLGCPVKALLGYPLWLPYYGLVHFLAVAPMPSTQTFLETWPGADGAITSTRDQVWTNIVGDFTVVSNVCRAAVVNTQSAAICDSDLDTSAQRHLATFHLANNAGGENTLSVKVRYSTQTNQYFFRLTRENGTFQRLTRKTVAGADTTFGNDATDPGGDATMELIVDGDQITSKIGGTTVHGPSTDGTPQLLTNFNGGIQIFAQATLADATLDTHTIADVVAAPSSFVPFTHQRQLGPIQAA